MNILITLRGNEEDSNHLNFVVNTVLATISFMIFLVLLYVGCKIFSIIKFSNKVITSMMFILQLDILAKCAFFSMNAKIYNNLPNEVEIPDFLFAMIPVAPVTLLSTAIVLNLNNWVFYYLKIGEMASHVDYKAIKLGDVNSLRKKRIILNGVTILAIVIIISTFLFVCY